MLNFIKREKIYILMLFFILAVNVMNNGRMNKEHYNEKKSFSGMTFKEIGITEGKVKGFFESDIPSARFYKYAIFFGFLIFIASLVLNIGFIFGRKPLPFRRKIKDDGAIHTAVVPWGISDIVRVSLIIIFITYVVGIIQAFVIKAFHINVNTNLRIIISTFFIDVFAACVLLYFVMVRYKERLVSIGLRFSGLFKNILSGITAYIFIIPLLLVILLVSIWFLNLLGYSPPPQPVFEVFMQEERSKILFFLTIFVSVFGPFVEEMFFRGFMYAAIKKRLGVLAAAFLSASIFSILHTNIVGFLPIMALGVLLAYLYETTGSLVAPIAVHIVHNSIIVSFVFFIKDLLFFSS